MAVGQTPTADDIEIRVIHQDVVTAFVERSFAYDVDGICDLFTEDALIRMHAGPDIQGRENFRAQQRKAAELHRLEPLYRLVTNLTAERTGPDTAVGRSTMLLLKLFGDTPLAPFALLEETDQLRRGPDGCWRIEERTSLPIVGGDHSPTALAAAGFTPPPSA